tara:strand:+ start:1394 stop:2677 length:1284 start_codon:yes stop_codon:yes gene_type:complete
MGTFNVFFGSFVHNIVIMLCAGLVLFFWMFRVIKFGKIKNFGLLKAEEFHYFLFFSVISAFYFSVHAVIVGPLSGIKYSAYLFLFFILITQLKRRDFDSLCIIYLYLMAFLAAMSVIQIGLVAISGLSPDQFDSIKLIEDDFFRDVDYVMPYLLGYMAVEESISFGPLNFVRAIGLSSEPKYFSVMLLVALSICIGWNSLRSKKELLAIKILLLLGIFFSHAYSSLLVIVFAVGFHYILKLDILGNKLKTIIIVLTPIILTMLLTAMMDFVLNFASGDGYAAARAASFLYSTSGADISSIGEFGLMGQNLGEEGSNIVSVTVLQNWFRFGHIGVALYFLPIFFVVYKTINNYKSIKKNQKRSIVLLLATYIVFYQIFFAQPYTLLSIFILAVLYNRSMSAAVFADETAIGIIDKADKKYIFPPNIGV